MCSVNGLFTQITPTKVLSLLCKHGFFSWEVGMALHFLCLVCTIYLMSCWWWQGFNVSDYGECCKLWGKQNIEQVFWWLVFTNLQYCVIETWGM